MAAVITVGAVACDKVQLNRLDPRGTKLTLPQFGSVLQANKQGSIPVTVVAELLVTTLFVGNGL